MQSNPSSRLVPRVILRKPIGAQFDGAPVLLLEVGLGGAKFEHEQRMGVGRLGTLTSGSLAALCVVRHSTLLPTARGVVYHTGVAFSGLDHGQSEQFFKLLIEEAQEQVKEWEANLGGIAWNPSFSRSSQVSRSFIHLHLTAEGWRRVNSTDPNQPLDGITVIDDTPKEEIRIVCETYQNGDDATRELLRRIAMLAILEFLHA